MEKLIKPKLPKRVMITGGMPNGNKGLHLGHIGAIFIWADTYARYMRDQIGNENVLFVSGTDGFGSSTEEKYRKQKLNNETSLSLPEYIKHYNNVQKQQMENYRISLNLFSASCFGEGLEEHIKVSHHIFKTLFETGAIKKVETEQFYDTELNVILNGRQVEGKCPIEGCKSEVGYADECSLGHQYNPKALIEPKSTLTNETPILKKVGNYYLDLEQYRSLLRELTIKYDEENEAHKFMIKDMKDYLISPSTYIDYKFKEKVEKLITLFDEPKVEYHEKRQLMQLIFKTVEQRDKACDILKQNDINFKNNKTIAPLRITGNAKWGVPMCEIETDPDAKNLTFYVWPESLWAPISFTKQYLKNHQELNTTWKDWWCSSDTKIVQFIGEDNNYFYCLAEMAIWFAMQKTKKPTLNVPDGELQIPLIVSNKHILIGNLKASSSGSLFAPTADSLLEHYTVEQLRCYFLSLNINNSAINFKSKVYMPNEFQNCGDPLVAPGNMLTNIFNRLIRSVFYSLQEYFNCQLPKIEPNENTINECIKTTNSFNEKMVTFKFNEVIVLLDEFFRKANQDWSVRSKSEDINERQQLIADTIHIIKTGLTLIHPIAPDGSQLVANYMNVGNSLWNFNHIDKTINEMFPGLKFKTIPPKFDFFKKHESQIK